MSAIGGFFEAEAGLGPAQLCHPEALPVVFGRAAFRIILEQLQPQCVWVPFYCCDALLKPLRLLRVPFRYYALNAQLLPELRELPEGDYAVVINYFGLQTESLGQFAARWPGQLIIDNTQAFYESTFPGCYAFNSARKFFGVPDGSYLYSPERLSVALSANTDFTLTHLVQRAAGALASAYQAYQAAEARVTTEVRGMSQYSQETLARVAHPEVRARRRENFLHYQRELSGWNTQTTELPAAAVPFCYPLLPCRPIERKRLYEQEIFVPTFWPEVVSRPEGGFALERQFACELLPLPVDHRYGFPEIQRVVDVVRDLVGFS